MKFIYRPEIDGLKKNNNDFYTHQKNNNAWEKIHSKSVYSQFPHSDTISLFETRFKNKNLSILELGCGSGNNQIYFRKKYSNVTGIDISTSAIKNSKKLLKKNKIKNVKNLIVMDIKNVQKIKKKYDIVYDFRSVSNLPKKFIKQFFIDIIKIIKIDGFFCFKLYSKKWIKDQRSKTHNIGKSKNIYLTTFSKKEIYDLIPRNFKIIKFEEHIYKDIIKNDLKYSEFDIIVRLIKL